MRPHRLSCLERFDSLTPDHQQARRDPSKKSPRKQACIGASAIQTKPTRQLGLEAIAVQFDFSCKRVFYDSPLFFVKRLLIRFPIRAVFRFSLGAEGAIERDL